MIRIGTSGWSYDHWADVLYPPGLPVAKRLARYVEEFDTVELNASFYRWPQGRHLRGMAAAAARRLHHGGEGASRADPLPPARYPEPWVERFERCWTALGDRARGAAGSAASRPGARRRAARPLPERDAESIPVAMELRHPSWNDPAVFALLERHRAAYVVMSGARCRAFPGPPAIWSTSGCTGPSRHSLYTGSYSDDDLRQWADRVSAWQEEGRRVVVYFNNDLGGHAVRNARRLKELTTPG